jgi:hypothetical protein
MTDETDRPAGDTAITTQRFLPAYRGRGGPIRQAVLLTAGNWRSVQAWMAAHGVHSHWSGGEFPRLSWGGRLGSYNVDPGCWIALSLGEDEGLPSAFDAYNQASWARLWDPDPEASPQAHGARLQENM